MYRLSRWILIILFFIFLSVFSFALPTFGEEKNLEIYPNNPFGVRGLSPIGISVNHFNKHLHTEVRLPKYIPFKQTDSGGHFSEKNKLLQIIYINQETNEKLYMLILYRPEGEVIKGKNEQILSLSDGTKAVYNHIQESDEASLRFKKGDLLYCFAISKNNNEEKVNDLLKVANSLR